MTTMRPGIQREPGPPPRPAAGEWRVDPAQSRALFTARLAGRPVRGRLPVTGRILIAERIADSTARLAARASQISTGHPVLDRQLTGPTVLDAAAFPEISFQSELLAWGPAGWRAVGRLRVKGTEHELACQLDVHRDGDPVDDSSPFRITSNWILDSRWIARQWIPGLSRHITMTCSFLLEQDL